MPKNPPHHSIYKSSISAWSRKRKLGLLRFWHLEGIKGKMQKPFNL
jgi:hypothetical protein